MLLVAAWLAAVHVSGDLPFAEAELDDALAARLGAIPSADVSVTPAAPGEIEVRVGAHIQRVVVGDRRGASAARLAAFAAVELLEPPTVRTPNEWRLVVAGGGAKGAATIEPLSGLGRIAATHALGRRWIAGGSLTWTILPTERAGTPYETSFQSWTVGAAAGLRLGPVDVQAGAFVAPYVLGGVATHAGALVGGSLDATAAGVLAGRVSLVAELGADLYANRIVVSAPILGTWFATPRVDVHGLVGVAFEVGR